MSYLRIVGRNPLYGEYRVPAAKNAVLPILAACVLIEGKVVLHGCPKLSDIDAMLAILRDLGADARQADGVVTVDCSHIEKCECISPLTGCMRSSLFLLGSILGRMRQAELGMVGGCVIGARPMDIHVEGLRAFGVDFRLTQDRIAASVRRAQSTVYRLPFPSVGATVNLLCFATRIGGVSRLENIAVEPEVVDLIHFLNQAGADIRLQGNQATIYGNKPLSGLEYKPIGDRIVAATILIAGAMTGGEVKVSGVAPEHCQPLLDKIGNSSCIRQADCDTILLCSLGKVRAFSLSTGVYPAFATDMQSLALAYNASACGISLVRERVFENRFALARELGKMGADIRVIGDTATVRGKRLHGADTVCCDLRAGAALVCASLASDGISTINHIGLIDRGYEHIERIFAMLGADITRMDER